MKKILISFLILTPCAAIATEPSTSNPSDYTQINEEHLILADGACPTGYTSVGTAESCLVGTPPAASCIMYAPTNTEYSDISGAYKFTAACPLE